MKDCFTLSTLLSFKQKRVCSLHDSMHGISWKWATGAALFMSDHGYEVLISKAQLMISY